MFVDISKQDVEMAEDETKVDDDEKSDPIKRDVQQMLDEMMVQTMKETEQQQSEMDSDLSGTEKIEEVVLKEDEVKDKNDAHVSPDKKSKLDSETDAENKKVRIRFFAFLEVTYQYQLLNIHSVFFFFEVMTLKLFQSICFSLD